MSNNQYYEWWRDNKPLLALVPAVVFWMVSMIFFVVGLRFNNPLLVFGKDVSTIVAVALTISNTVIQIIGNEQESDRMGIALWIGWIASYVLGIGTNISGLASVLSVQSVNLEWAIAFGLGTMIEVLPERLLVMFLRTWTGSAKLKAFRPQNRPYNPNSPVMNKIPKKDNGERPPWDNPAHSVKGENSKQERGFKFPG